jgi:hypothetical protein
MRDCTVQRTYNFHPHSSVLNLSNDWSWEIWVLIFKTAHLRQGSITRYQRKTKSVGTLEQS